MHVLFFFRVETCPICLDTMTNPRSLKCKHMLCSVCIQSALDVSNKCPVCQEPQGVLQRNQPPREMTFRVERYSVQVMKVILDLKLSLLKDRR